MSGVDSLGHLLVLHYPMIKLQQPNPGRMTKDTDPSRMKLRVTPGNEPRPAEVLPEGGGNTEWVIKKGSYKYQLRPHDQLQNRIIIKCFCHILLRICTEI